MSENFFRSVMRMQCDARQLVLVTHLLPGVEDFIFSLKRFFRIAAIIPKPNSINCNTYKAIKETTPLLEIKRDFIKSQPGEFLQRIDSATQGEKYAVIDTGGYFSHVIFSQAKSITERLVGIVEDTENGHQKYEAALQRHRVTPFPCPVISVARSALKDPEDLLVGQAIVFSADALLREHGHVLSGQNALILGYGKIGRSIADHLRRRCVAVKVIDVNPARQALAIAHGYRSAMKSAGLGESDLIFAATGNGSLSLQDFSDMRSETFVFTATSGDDEFGDYQALMGRCKSTPHSRVLRLNEHKPVYICNRGNSVNFLHDGVVGPFIKLVQGELAFALGAMAQAPVHRISTLEKRDKEFIAAQWIRAYGTHWGCA